MRESWRVLAATLLIAGTALAKPSNVIVIMADDIGFECYGAYGSEFYKTPHIDKLAQDGAQFLHAYSQPICTPSRVKIMTGKYNFRNYTRFGHMDLTQRTFAHAVKDAGYKTCVAGKWQLSPGNLKGPFTTGFDEYCLWHFEGNGMGNKGSRFKSPQLYLNGKQIEGTEGKYGPDYAADFICDFIERNKEQPFLVYYPMILVHSPFVPTPDSADWAAPRSKRSALENFQDMVAYMDKKIGQIVKKLEGTGLREDTLIIVTGDNGTHKSLKSPFPSRGAIQGGKGSMKDNGTHVAFVASWPGTIKPGTKINSPIDFSDVFPTVCDVMEAPVPNDLDGQSLLPLLMGDESQARGWAFVDYSRNGTPPYHHFVRTERYKLYSNGKMYDIPNDWGETRPLRNPELEPIRKTLQGILDKKLKDHPSDDEIRVRQKGGAVEPGKPKKKKEKRKR